MYKPSSTRPLELAAISACASGQERLDRLMMSLHDEHFSEEDTKALFVAVREMYQGGYAVDPSTLRSYVESEKGMAPEVVDEACSIPVTDPRVVVKSLTTMRGRRGAHELGEYLVSQDAAKDGMDAIIGRINKFTLVYSKTSHERNVSLSEFMDKIGMVADRPTIIHPGFGEIDTYYRFRPGTLNTIAAPPGVGKTALLLNMANNAARAGHKSLIISLEVPDFDLRARLTAIMCGVPASAVRDKMLSEQQIDHIRAIAAQNQGIVDNINVEAPAKMSVDAVQAMINRYVATKGIGIVFLDYLQSLSSTGKSEYDRVTYTSETLSQTAKVTGIPIVAASSTRRKSAGDKDDATMHDMRASGQIEFDSHTIAMVKRNKDNKNLLEFELVKNRDSACWGTTLYYDFITQRITANV
ncbi:MAG: hypothetical protein E6Q97_08805 [Desulfurellales bacterium]|nr:MAG: hypothetical protein E6Q97_08805 [Desulfurellales bacterium]